METLMLPKWVPVVILFAVIVFMAYVATRK